MTINFLTVGAEDTSLDSSLTLHSWSHNLTGISNKFVRFFFTNCEVDFLYTRFVRISQRVFWQSVCFWCIVRYHMRLSRTNFDNLRYWSQSFLVRKLLAIDFLTVRTVDTGLDCSLALNSRSRYLTGILWQLICVLFFNIEGDFLYTSFIGISQLVLWQSIGFRSFIRYHMRLSPTNFDNLRYWSESFLIRQLLAVNFLTVGTVDTGLDSSLALNSWNRYLTGTLS